MKSSQSTIQLDNYPDRYPVKVTLPNKRRQAHVAGIGSQGMMIMDELIFIVNEAPEGGYAARALGESIFTEADSLEDLREEIREAVKCHFEDDSYPRVVRIHFVREEMLAV